MEGRSLAASSKRFVRASSTMKTVGSLAYIALDITIILCIVRLCNLIGSNPRPTSPHRSILVKRRVGRWNLIGTSSVHTHKTTQLTNFWKRQEQNTKTSRAIMAPCPINPETTTVVGFAAGIGLSPSLRLPSATPKERGQQVEHAAKKEGGEKEDAEEGKDKAMDHCGWTSRPVPHSVVFPKSCVRTRQKRRPRKRPRRRKRGRKRRAN